MKRTSVHCVCDVKVGYRPVAEEGEFWWASCFNRAANSLTVSNTTEVRL